MAGGSSSKAQALAEFLRARPGVWVDARVLARIGGLLSWRTRLSELRRPPFNLEISNRTRSLKTGDGQTLIASEYRFGPPDPAR